MAYVRHSLAVVIGLGIAWWIGQTYGTRRVESVPVDRPPAEAGTSGALTPQQEEAVRRDIEALLRGEGTLPEGYVPAGSALDPGTDAGEPGRGPGLGGAVLRPTGAKPPALEVVAVEVASAAAKAGLRVGDRIAGIDGAPPGPDTLLGAVQRLRDGSKLRLRVLRKEGESETLEMSRNWR